MPPTVRRGSVDDFLTRGDSPRESGSSAAPLSLEWKDLMSLSPADLEAALDTTETPLQEGKPLKESTEAVLALTLEKESLPETDQLVHALRLARFSNWPRLDEWDKKELEVSPR